MRFLVEVTNINNEQQPARTNIIDCNLVSFKSADIFFNIDSQQNVEYRRHHIKHVTKNQERICISSITRQQNYAS